MLELSLPGFDYKVKKQNGTVMIFDIVRKKYVVLTPEEWVRQHVVHYLVEKKGYAISRVAVEREIELYGLKRRFDTWFSTGAVILGCWSNVKRLLWHLPKKCSTRCFAII